METSIVHGTRRERGSGRAGAREPESAAHDRLRVLLPSTRMVHSFSKYFTFHEVRRNDRPREEGSTLDRRRREALDSGVDWWAAHARTGTTWAEVAANLPEEPAAGE